MAESREGLATCPYCKQAVQMLWKRVKSGWVDVIASHKCEERAKAAQDEERKGW